MPTQTSGSLGEHGSPVVSRLLKGQVVIVLIVVVLTVLVGIRIPRLLKEKAKVETDLTLKKGDLDRTDKKLEEAKKVLLAINPILEKYGVLKKLTVDDLNSDLVKESFEANQEIQRVLIRSYNQQAIPIWYFSKDVNVDPEAVKKSLEELGFNLVAKPAPRPDLPSNTVAFGENLPADKGKLVVYTLIRAGIPIKAMCQSARPSVIQVYGDERLLNKPTTTVEHIRSKSSFVRCPSSNINDEWPADY